MKIKSLAAAAVCVISIAGCDAVNKLSNFKADRGARGTEVRTTQATVQNAESVGRSSGSDSQPSAGGDARGLPQRFAITSYGTTSFGYRISVAIAKAVADEGYKLRVIPAKNDVSRLLPLKSGRVKFSATGIGAYFAQEGIAEFRNSRWGPQEIRLIMMAFSPINQPVVATAKDANISDASDLRGKRIAFIIGGFNVNHSMESWLAYGGLRWDDVTKVEVSGWKASIQGMIDGNIDAAIASTNSSMLHQVAGSPRGLHFFPAPVSEREAWNRLRKRSPWMVPNIATEGIGLSESSPLAGATSPYPIFVTYAHLSDPEAFEFTRLLHTKHGDYKHVHPAAQGMAMDRQIFDWVIPYHDGAIRYFKEIGVWASRHQRHNDKLLNRQKVLRETFSGAVAEKGGSTDFSAFWMEKRAEALIKAGMNPIWEK